MASPNFASSINNFIAEVAQGVKPNLFEVSFITAPGGGTFSADDSQNLSFLCKAAALPASNLGTIEVPYRGRTIKIAGDRTFDTWTATFINDFNFQNRQIFENWMRQINSHEGNVGDFYRPSIGGAADSYLADIEVKQLERNSGATTGDRSEIVRRYFLKGAFPTNVSQIDLAYDSNDQIEEFTVEFQYQYWTVEAGAGSRAPGVIG